jgi:hypothetical protein
MGNAKMILDVARRDYALTVFLPKEGFPCPCT